MNKKIINIPPTTTILNLVGSDDEDIFVKCFVVTFFWKFCVFCPKIKGLVVSNKLYRLSWNIFYDVYKKSRNCTAKIVSPANYGKDRSFMRCTTILNLDSDSGAIVAVKK